MAATSRSSARGLRIGGARTIGLVVVALVALVAVGAPRVIRGARFGAIASHFLPSTAGHIEIGGGTWTWGTLFGLLTGGDAPLSLTDVRVGDPKGIEVLRAHVLSGRLRVRRGPWRLAISDVRIDGAHWRFARMDGGADIGFLKAFEPVGTAARPRTHPRPPPGNEPLFQITDAQFDGLDVELDLPGWQLDMKNVRASGQLAIGAGAAHGPALSFEVRDADARGGGRLQILEGKNRVELPFSRGLLERVATTVERPDAIALAASGVTTGRSTMTLRALFSGVFRAAPAGAHSGMDLHVAIADAADAVAAVVAGRRADIPFDVAVAGRDAGFALAIVGPFDAITADVEARGFDVKVRDVDMRQLGFRLSLDPAAGHGRLSGLTVTSPAGGKLGLDVEVAQMRATGAITFDQFATGPYLPAVLRPLVGGTLAGVVHAHADLAARSAGLDDMSLALARPTTTSGPHLVTVQGSARGASGQPAGRVAHAGPAEGALALRLSGARFANGVFDLPAVATDLWGGRVVAGGTLAIWDPQRHDWLPSPMIDLRLACTRISPLRLLGVGFLGGAMSFSAHARGGVQDFSLRLSFPERQVVSILGQGFQLPSTLAVRFEGDDVLIPEVVLRGVRAGELTAAGRIGMSGRIDLRAGVRDFPIGSLPGLTETELPFAGRLSGDVRVVGDRREQAVSGQIALANVSVAGRPLGSGSLEVTPAAHGAIVASGHLGDALTVHGTLSPRPTGLAGEAQLEVRQLRLDPFLTSLPGGLAATGVMSGTATARIEPGEPARLAGVVTALALEVRRVRGARGDKAGVPGDQGARNAVALLAVGEIPFAAEARGGPIQIGPARFAGDAGRFEMLAEAKGDRRQGSLRGRVELGVVEPLLAPWIDRASGAVDVDLSVTDGSPPSLTGQVAVATPLAVRARALPFQIRMAAGTIAFRGRQVSTKNLTVAIVRDAAVSADTASTGAAAGDDAVLRVAGRLDLPADDGPALVRADATGSVDARIATRLVPSAIRTASGTLSLTAHVDGSLADPKLSARVALSRPIELVLAPGFGSTRVRVAGGPIDIEGPTITAGAIDVSVGDSVHATIGGDGVPATCGFDSLRFEQLGPVDVPVRGSITGLSASGATIDQAAFQLRLAGDPRRRLRLSGDMQVQAARVGTKLQSFGGGGGGGALAAPSSGSWRARPEAARTDLDLRVRAAHGAVRVEVPHAPDPHINADFHVGGTLRHPQTTGSIHPAGVYSSFVFLLYRLFH